MNEKSSAKIEKSSAISPKSSAKSSASSAKSSARYLGEKKYVRKKVYNCICCSYSTVNISNYKKHLKSKKHLKNMSSEKVITNEKKSSQMKKSHHNSKKVITNEKKSSQGSENETLHSIINQQQQQIKQLTELCQGLVKTSKSTINNNTTNNNTTNNTINNNNYSINVYLGDHCKNALNIKDFVESINVRLEDCLYPSSKLVKKNIVSKLFLDDLKKLSNEERPVHCADASRGKYFVKDKEDQWTEMNQADEYNPLDEQIGRLKIKVYGVARDAEEKGIINDDKVQKIREACEISNDSTKINTKILQNIADKCSIHDARKKKKLENIEA